MAMIIVRAKFLPYPERWAAVQAAAAAYFVPTRF
jgi:hypothetical protein